MRTADEWNWIHTKICAGDPAVHGQLLPTPKMVELIKKIQEDALLHAERIAEATGFQLRSVSSEMEEGAIRAASNICLEIYNLGAALEKGDPTREGDSAKLAPLTPSLSGPESL